MILFNLADSNLRLNESVNDDRYDCVVTVSFYLANYIPIGPAIGEPGDSSVA